MNDYRPAHNLGRFKLVGEKAHGGPAPVGEQHREVSGVVAVGLVIRAPVFPGGLERVLGIAHRAVPDFMNMKAVGAYGVSVFRGWLVRWKTVNVDIYSGTPGYVFEANHPGNLGGQGAAKHNRLGSTSPA